MGMKDKANEWQEQGKQKLGETRERAGQRGQQQSQRGQQQSQRGQQQSQRGQQPQRGRENMRDIEDTEAEMEDRFDRDYDA
ncbi:hypothetical protein GCM10010260_25560 [Streptomyces filipinensis]|uniref:Uncharacterized protein n=1 Tax=Streptomyces filipinensis TaxID=66887 RepID=A0A918I964_9ACTN|nr:hypothetical protein [Streptomyces filipinensis]GGU90092.1 hypothetical protein GCM10010260_25560 [Streptomyces filipinensis]